MPKNSFFYFSIALLQIISSFTYAATASEADNSVLVYGKGIQYKTVVYQTKLLGQLEAKDKEPFLVFSGLGCDECDINRSIYIHSPSDPAMESGQIGDRYAHPGKYYEADGKTLYEVIRMFIGACLPQKKNAVIWLSNTKVRKEKWEKNIFVAQVEDGKIAADYISKNSALFRKIGSTIHNKACKEIRGENFSSEP